jgi:hypothetical protein
LHSYKAVHFAEHWPISTQTGCSLVQHT